MDNKGLVMNRLKMGFGLTVALALTGCGSSPPECSDGDVTDTVKSIVINKFRQAEYAKYAARQGIYDELNYERAVLAQDENELLAPLVEHAEEVYPDDFLDLEAIRTQSVNEQSMQTSCAAMLTRDNGNQMNITYSAQVTDDGEVWIEVYGL